MKPLFLSCFALIISGALDIARADATPGVEWYVRNAKTIEVVQAETAAQLAAFPSPQDSQRLWVKDVLKGIDSTQEFSLSQGGLKPGESALVLFQYDEEPYSQEPSQAHPGIVVWPMDASGHVNTGRIPAETEDGKGLLAGDGPGGVKLELVKADIKASSPEEVGLNDQVVEALLFPDKFRTLAGRDANRATYVRFVIAILDLNHGGSFMAPFLESQNPAIRAAALRNLKTMIKTEVDAPKDENPQAIHEWAQTWEKQMADREVSTLRWPPVPPNFIAQPDAFPESLLRALQKNDADGFAPAYSDWLRSGVMRDREIAVATDLDQKIVEGSNLYGARQSAYLPASPRLQPEVILNKKIPTVDRMKAIALFAQIAFVARFSGELDAAKARLLAIPPDAEILRRAAFWEWRDGYWGLDPKSADIRSVAWDRLVETGDDEASQRWVLSLCINPEVKMEDAVDHEIQAGRKTFIDGLFAYLKTHDDEKARFFGLELCESGNKQAIPIAVSWLKSKDHKIRYSAAHSLYDTLAGNPYPEYIPDLLAAIPAEHDTETKAMMLAVLARTGDKRGLETLLEAVRGFTSEDGGEDEADMVRGLGRIGDPRALPVLADLAKKIVPSNSKQRDELTKVDGLGYVLPDVVEVFGTISHLYEPRDESDLVLKQGVARIEEWRKSHPDL